MTATYEAYGREDTLTAPKPGQKTWQERRIEELAATAAEWSTGDAEAAEELAEEMLDEGFTPA